MTLRTRRLGRDGPEITAVGFGAWAIGGGGWSFGWGAQDDRESLAAIGRALERGVNWVDTAAVYGHGHSEEVVGRAVREAGAPDTLIFTKCGLRWDEGRDEIQDLRPESIREECEASLRRLGRDHIDLYQFHWPDAQGVPVEESWGEMARLAEAGKVRWAGVSNFDVGLLERCERIRHVDSLQPPFSLLSRETAQDLLPWCADHGTGVIVYSPMESGLLTGKFSAQRVAALADDDWRKHDSGFQEPALSRSLRLVDELRPLAERRGVPLPALVVGWTLAWPAVTGAIVGARRPEQVDEWLPAADLVLDEDDLEGIAAALARAGAGSGPVGPARRA